MEKVEKIKDLGEKKAILELNKIYYLMKEDFDIDDDGHIIKLQLHGYMTRMLAEIPKVFEDFRHIINKVEI